MQARVVIGDLPFCIGRGVSAIGLPLLAKQALKDVGLACLTACPFDGQRAVNRLVALAS